MSPSENTSKSIDAAKKCTVHFPYFSLIMVLAVSILVAFGVVWHKDKISQNYSEIFKFSNQMTSDLGLIALTDEVLAMSALVSTMSADQEWVNRYNEAVVTMDDALARISEIAPADLLQTLDEETGEANSALIEMEQKALDLVTSGQAEEARALLDSDNYQIAREKLLSGALKFEDGIRVYTEARKAELENEITQSFWISIVGILIILGAWISLFVTLKKWESGLKEAEIENRAVHKRQVQHEKQTLDLQREQEMKRAHERKETLQKLAQQLEDTVGSVVSSTLTASEEMNLSAHSMVKISSQTTSQASGVASSAQAASNNVETVANAAEELNASITQIGRQVNEATGIAQKAVVDADTTNHQIQGLADAAQKIGDVVSLITTIADQTNLLALNATIEAARAGDAGKGFAVVASEVKNLANQTAKATQDIIGQVTSIQEATKESVKAVQDIGQTIAKIEHISSAISSAVEQQGSATQEIARNVEEASSGTQNVTREIAAVSQSVEETGSASQSIVSGTSHLGDEVKKLEKQISTFLQEIRTGS